MEVIFQRLETHMTFICPECGESFELQQQWRQHLNFHHDYLCKTPEDFGFVEINDRYHECLECNQLVADGKRAIALLQYHRFVHLPHKCTYRCRHCLATFMRKRICFSHLCRSHEDVVGKKLAAAAMKTPMLNNKKENTTKLADSSCIAKHNPEFYLRCICPQCGYEVNTTDEWLKHIETAHEPSLQPNNALEAIPGTEDFVCTICESIICNNDKEKHLRHYFSHLPHKLMFRCAYCRIRRPFKTEILHHFMTTHLLVFEKQRLFMRKPKEFGHDINKKLDRELDLLLKYGNSVGAPQGSTWPKLYSVNNKPSTPRSLTPIAKKNIAEKSGIIKKAIVNNVADIKKESSQNINRTSNIKKELDALCAEIFKDIENDEPIEENVMETTKSKLTDYFLADSIENLGNENEFSTGNKNIEEEVVSIEIDTLDEHELNQIHKIDESNITDVVMTETSPVEKLEIYPNLKALYNAKVLHLCPQCGKSFAQQSVWREHVLTTHEDLYKLVEQSYKLLDDQSNLCLTCNSVLYTRARAELQRHRFSHMPFSAYLKCTLCEKCKISKPHMLEHLENSHADHLKSVHDHYTTQPGEKNLKYDEIHKKMNQTHTTLQPSVQTSTENTDFVPLLTHLQNARVRLNRMAAELGIVQH